MLLMETKYLCASEWFFSIIWLGLSCVNKKLMGRRSGAMIQKRGHEVY
jgi:hypothetical protein